MKQTGSQSIVLCFINLGVTLNGNKQCTSCLSHFIPTEQEIGQALELVWTIWRRGEKTLGPARIHTPDHTHCGIVTIPTTLFKLPSGETRNIYHICYITFNLLEDGDISLSQVVVM